MSEQISIRLVAIDDVSSVMASVSQKTRQIAESNAQRLLEIERRKAQRINEINNKSALSAQQRAQKIQQIEQRASSQLVNIKEREAMRIRHIMERTAAHQKRLAKQNSAGANFGRGAVAGGVTGMFGSTIGSGFSGYAVGGAAGAAGGLAVGLAQSAAGVFLSGVRMTSDLIVGGVKNIVGGFADAITEIGGGFSIKDSIVREVKAERMAARISTAGLGDVSAAFANQEASRMSRGSEFTKLQVMQGMAAYQKQTGNLGNALKNQPGRMEDMLKLSTISGLGVPETAGLVGQIESAFPELKGPELDKVIRGLIGQGAKGAVEFEDLPAMVNVLGKAGSIGSGSPEDIAKVASLIQLAKPGIGSVDEAATATNRFLMDIQKAGLKGTGLSKSLGVQMDGGTVTNMKDVVANAVLAMQAGGKRGAAVGQMDARGVNFVSALSNKIGKEGTEDERREKLMKLMEAMDNETTSREDLDRMLGVHTDTLDYQLKQMFNNLQETFGPELTDIIKNTIKPKLEEGFKWLTDNKEVISGAIEKVIEALINLGSNLPQLASILTGVFGKLSQLIIDVLMFTGHMTKEEGAEAKAGIAMTTALLQGKRIEQGYLNAQSEFVGKDEVISEEERARIRKYISNNGGNLPDNFRDELGRLGIQGIGAKIYDPETKKFRSQTDDEVKDLINLRANSGLGNKVNEGDMTGAGATVQGFIKDLPNMLFGSKTQEPQESTSADKVSMAVDRLTSLFGDSKDKPAINTNVKVEITDKTKGGVEASTAPIGSFWGKE